MSTRCRRCHFPLALGVCQCGGKPERGEPDPIVPPSITSSDPLWFTHDRVKDLTLLAGPKACRAPSFVNGKLGEKVWHIRKDGNPADVNALCGTSVSLIVESLFHGKAIICLKCRKLYAEGSR